MSESLTAKLCKAIAATIKAHPDTVDANEIVGCLMTSVAAYSNVALGTDKTLIQLVVQMQCITKVAGLNKTDAHYKIQETLERAMMIAEMDYADALPAMVLFRG